MADEIDAQFMFGGDLGAILDVLEEDERIHTNYGLGLECFLGPRDPKRIGRA